VQQAGTRRGHAEKGDQHAATRHHLVRSDCLSPGFHPGLSHSGFPHTGDSHTAASRLALNAWFLTWA